MFMVNLWLMTWKGAASLIFFRSPACLTNTFTEPFCAYVKPFSRFSSNFLVYCVSLDVVSFPQELKLVAILLKGQETLKSCHSHSSTIFYDFCTAPSPLMAAVVRQ